MSGFKLNIIIMHIIHALANRSLSSHAIYLADKIFCVEVVNQSDKD